MLTFLLFVAKWNIFIVYWSWSTYPHTPYWVSLWHHFRKKVMWRSRMHIGYRWFVGLHMNDEVADHSSFSKNRHGRFKESGIFQEIFDEIVRQCITHGLVSGKHLSIDGSLVKADVSVLLLCPSILTRHKRHHLREFSLCIIILLNLHLL